MLDLMDEREDLDQVSLDTLRELGEIDCAALYSQLQVWNLQSYFRTGCIYKLEPFRST
jgi:hypothetical protein